MDKKIAITGVGVISNLGHSIEEYWKNRGSENIDGLVDVTFDTTHTKAKKAFAINKYDAKEFIPRRFIKPLDQVTRYCLSGSGLALNDANLEETDKSAIGLVAGSKYHGLFSIFNIKETYFEGGVEEVSPVYFPGTVFNASGAQAAIEWKLTGPNCTVNNGNASGLTSVIKGVEYLLLDKAEAMVCGGNEMLFDYILNKYDHLDLLSYEGENQEICRPFDKNGNGMILGEGACYFTLENNQIARNKESKVYANIINYSYNFNKDKNKTKESIIDCIEDALNINGIDFKDKVDLVIADGCGITENDTNIALAIKECFKQQPYVTSNKASIGHTLGASGAFNLLEGVLSIKNQAIMPIQNLLSPIVPLNFVTEPTSTKINYVLITSFDADGNNACILIEKA